MFKHSPFRIASLLALSLALAACGPDRDNRDDRDRDDDAPSAQSQDRDSDGSSAGINESTRKLFGGAEPTSVAESPIEGLMEVHVAGNVYYASPDGRYFMQGDMIEVSTMKSQTDAARTAPREKAMGDIDTSQAITYKAKDEKHEVYVFTDVTCPYCTKFHNEMERYNNNGITVHYFAWPRSGPDSPAYDDMVSAWCAQDQKKAIDRLFDGKSIDQDTCDDQPVDQHLELGRRLMVNGTPAIFTPDARQHGGYVSADDLLKSIEANQAR